MLVPHAFILKMGTLVASYLVTLRHAVKDSCPDFFLWKALRFIPFLGPAVQTKHVRS